MEKIAVIGAGLMGHGIAQVFATNGHDVTVCDPVAEVLEQVPERVRANLLGLGYSESAAQHISRHLTLSPELTAAAGADFVFEAAPEKLPLKREIFAQLADCTGPHCVLASNTSVIPIRQISAGMLECRRVLGCHWWNPPYLVPLVEVVQSGCTDDALITRTIDLLRRVGKSPVHVQRDIPGFIGNRLMHALWREAISLVNDGVCDAATIDLVVKNSFGMRLPVLGPMENADLVGLDLTLDIQGYILPHLETSGQPSPLLARNVAEKRLGMKTGEGFYKWTEESAQAVHDRLTQHLRRAVRLPKASE
jgi:3-hydroxybutyryl-CoA dehydrogenase